MKKAMRIIKEAHNVERERRQTSRKKRSEEAATRTQKAKALISNIKRGGMRRVEIEGFWKRSVATEGAKRSRM